MSRKKKQDSKERLYNSDKVIVCDDEKLFLLLKGRNFCTDDETRQQVADEIGGKTGLVQSIEDKYADDYFFFRSIEGKSYCIPVEAVVKKK